MNHLLNSSQRKRQIMIFPCFSAVTWSRFPSFAKLLYDQGKLKSNCNQKYHGMSLLLATFWIEYGAIMKPDLCFSLSDPWKNFLFNNIFYIMQSFVNSNYFSILKLTRKNLNWELFICYCLEKITKGSLYCTQWQ